MKDLQRKPNLYVGCGLTHAPQEFREQVEQTKSRLGDDWEVMQFLGLEAGSSGDVYIQDIERNVLRCDAFLAIADEASTGLGWELGMADARQVPTLIVAHVGARVSRLVLGSAEVRPHIQFARYESVNEILKLARATLLTKTVIQ